MSYWNEWHDWRFRLEHFKNPPDSSDPDSLPAVSADCIDLAYEFMKEAEKVGMDDLLDVGWDDNAIDISLKDSDSNESISVIIGYADEWSVGNEHEVVLIPWHMVFSRNTVGDINSYHPKTPPATKSIDIALGWILTS